MSTDPEGGSFVTYSTDIKKTPVKEGKVKYQSLLKQLSLDLPNTEEDKGLQKHDSFSRWMSNELEEVSDSHMQASSSAIYWDAVDSESVVNSSTMSDQDQMDAYLLSPSVSQDQLFSIDDFSPGWAFSDSGTKQVVVSGSFLKNRNDVDKCKWSCMFGEVEVPAEILADGVLQCHAPPRKSGRVPFYITCSNRSACSEVREFEYRDKNDKCLETSEPCSESLNKIMLYIRLEKFLSDGSLCHLEAPVVNNDKSHICKKISLLLMETDDGLPLTSKGMAKKEFYMDRPANDQLRQKQLKEKLHTWLIHKVTEDGKGPNILDNEGQGVIHLAAALGYDWAVAPTIFAGVNINFRDTHGWTALHWAASYGRESTVATLVSFGADSGAVTDPTPEFPSGRTPSDLASKNGHKGIAGFLANSSLTSHLSMLTLKQSGENNISSTSSINNSEDAVEKKVLDHREGDPLKNSLDAVRTAADAAARIHQVFRVQSFQRKEATKYDEISKEHALSLISMKRTRTGHHDEPGHAAAVQIQNRFRGWKGRKEFLIIRQRIVKIQAHVRGHQVRKHFRKFVWTVGIVEKVILRWRRKGTGLRGFRPETSVGTAMQALPAVKEDDYDFLKEGRRQTEAKFDRALARVQSMVQYPDARAQYWRMLNAEKFQESKKAVLENILNDPDVAMDADTMFELEELLGDDTLMHD